MDRFGSRQSFAGKDTGAMMQRAIEHAAIGDFAQAIDVLHEVTKASPDFLLAWSAKATLYRLIGNHKMANLCRETAETIGARK